MKRYLASALIMQGALLASATTPLWLRDVAISPQGDRIAFTYKGDIYTVPTSGGNALRLTTQPSYEANPIWSPDGSKIAFASDRNGSFDIFLMPSQGGEAKRITSNSSSEIPQAFSADGKNILFSAPLQDAPESLMFPYRRQSELYSVPVEGGAFVQLLTTPAVGVNFIGNTGKFLYNDIKGPESEWRKHHTSSITRDVWMYDPTTGAHTNLTNHGGEDLSPVASPDGNKVYFLSEREGDNSINLYSFDIDNPSKVTKLTDFATHPLRFLSMGADGTLAFTYDGEIYTMRNGSKPEKVNIDIITDDTTLPEIKRFSSGASQGVPSPDGKMVAFVHGGDIFVTSADYATTKQITSTPQGEWSPTWGTDNRTLYYASDRDGKDNIYKATIGRTEDSDFANATLINEQPLFAPSDTERTNPLISPDGKKMAFIQDRRNIAVMNLADKKVNLLTHGETYTARDAEFMLSWSPDGKWLAAAVDVHQRDPYYDIAIINAETGELTNITDNAYMNMNPRWVMNGDAILFFTERYGMKAHASWGNTWDAVLVFTNQKAYDRYLLSEEDYALLKDKEKNAKKADEPKADDNKKKSGKDKAKDDAKTSEKPAAKQTLVELDGITDRMVRLTPFSAQISDGYVTDDGETFYFIAKADDNYSIWKKDLRKGDVKTVGSSSSGVAIHPDAKGKTLFLLGSSMKKMDLPGEKIKAITYSGTQKINPAEQREYMFDYIVEQEAQRFYRTDMHGVDWPALSEAYRKFLPHINNNYDFAELGSELLGELNVSHTGAYYSGKGAKETTGSLGLLYDMTYQGPGLKVEEVVIGGPFARAASKMRKGALITAINSTPLTENVDFSEVLNGTIGKKTLVEFRLPAGEVITETVKPISLGAQNARLYDRWVKRNEALVDSLSGGRLGYVHLQSMNDASYREVYEKVLGKYNERDGIVIDTRWNGGGRLHEDIEVLFSGDKYLTQEIRGVVSGQMPSRRWNKPSIMVIGEANYSNAHGTPWVYKNRGIGRLVGMPVPGTMSSVNWVTLQDPSLYFGIPVVGFRTADGTFLENTQLEPDIKVANDPARIAKGIDDQIEAAVKALLKDIDSAK